MILFLEKLTCKSSNDLWKFFPHFVKVLVIGGKGRLRLFETTWHFLSLVWFIWCMFYIILWGGGDLNTMRQKLCWLIIMTSYQKTRIWLLQLHVNLTSRVTFQILLHHKYARNIKIRNFIRFEDEIWHIMIGIFVVVYFSSNITNRIPKYFYDIELSWKI